MSNISPLHCYPWWRHFAETFSTLLALYEGNPLVIVGLSPKGPVMFVFCCPRETEKPIHQIVELSMILYSTNSMWRNCNVHIVFRYVNQQLPCLAAASNIFPCNTLTFCTNNMLQSQSIFLSYLSKYRNTGCHLTWLWAAWCYVVIH